MPDADTDLAKLAATANHGERNELALRLADERAPGLPEVLVALMGREELRNHRGTLVYCLGFFDCSERIELLCELLVEGDFEVAHEAYDILGTIESAAGPQVDAAARRLSTALDDPGLEDWRRELVVAMQPCFD